MSDVWAPVSHLKYVGVVGYLLYFLTAGGGECVGRLSFRVAICGAGGSCGMRPLATGEPAEGSEDMGQDRV